MDLVLIFFGSMFVSTAIRKRNSEFITRYDLFVLNHRVTLLGIGWTMLVAGVFLLFT